MKSFVLESAENQIAKGYFSREYFYPVYPESWEVSLSSVTLIYDTSAQEPADYCGIFTDLCANSIKNESLTEGSFACLEVITLSGKGISTIRSAFPKWFSVTSRSQKFNIWLGEPFGGSRKTLRRLKVVYHLIFRKIYGN